MSTLNIGGNEVPTIAVALAMPAFAALYVAWAGYFSESSLVARRDAAIAMEAEVEEKKGQVQNLMERAKQFDVIKAEIAGYQKRITLLRSRIPAEAQIAVLLYDIERMAKASGSEVETFEPTEVRAYAAPTQGAAEGDAAAGGVTQSSGDIFEVPIKVSAFSTYPQLINFFNQINKYERKLTVSGVTIARKDVPKIRSRRALTDLFKVVNSLDQQLGGGAPLAGLAGVQGSVLGQPYRNSLKVEFTVSAFVLKQGEVVQ